MKKCPFPPVEIGNKYGNWTVLDGPIIKYKRNRKLKFWKVQCDCGNTSEIEDYQLKSGGTKSCGCLKQKDSISHITNHKESLYDWCLSHNRLDLIERWDDEKNTRKITDAYLGSTTKFWFKCLDHPEHGSELKGLQILFHYPDSKLPCSRCNSVEMRFKEFMREDLLARWDYERNGCSPIDFKFSVNSWVWLKCPCEKHESCKYSLNTFHLNPTCEFKCNYCNSFAQYGIDNFGEDFLKKYWDYDKNKYSPWDLSKMSNKTIWIKCQKSTYHGSYQTKCCKFIEGKRCPYCSKTTSLLHKYDSIGSVYPEIIDLWSDKNNFSYYEISPHSGKKIWLKCSEGKHDDYFIIARNAVASRFKCPKCSKESTESSFQKRVSKYLNSKYPDYTILHEYDCSLKAINEKTKNQMPYDNEIAELKLLIEVQGQQHYEINQFTKFSAKRNNITVEEAFEEQKYRDREKEKIAYDNGYNYLAIPYFLFQNEEYKELIDNKINEIIN